MKSRKKMGNLKKSIKHFIKDEKGCIEKDKVIKVGLGTISALTVISALSAPKNACAASHTNDTNHSNGLIEEPVAGTNCRRLKPVNTTTHNNHSSGGK